MSIFIAIGKGIGTSFRKSRLLVYLWIVNCVFALITAAPILFLLRKELGHSLMGNKVQALDILWLGEVFYKYQDILPVLGGWLLVPLFSYFFLFIFLNGGIIGRLVAKDERTTLQTFLGDSGKYFWRFFRAFLFSLLAYFLLLGLFLQIVSALFNPFIERAQTEWTGIIFSNIHFLILLLILSLIHMFFDFVRIIIVAEDESKVVRALGRAFRFIRKRFLRVWLLYLLVFVIFILGTILTFMIKGVLPESGLSALAIGFLWAQVFVLFRLWTKMLFFAAEHHYYSENIV